ncbi:hypothetical protein Tco_1284729 [Tanacetum coccineum]
MIQQVQNSCQFHGLPGDDANKHLDKFLTVTQSMKQNGVPDDALKPLIPLSLFFDTSCHRLSDTINAVAGGTFMKRRPEECYDLIKNMATHHNDWDTSAQKGGSSSSITSSSPEIAALTHCETCGRPHHYSECQAASGFTQGDIYAAMGNFNAGANQMTKMEKAFNERRQGALPSNTIPNHREEVKVITTWSGMTLDGPSVPPPPPLSSSSKEVKRDPEPTMDQMFKKLHFNISLVEALALVPKYAKILKDLLTNKEKLLEMANTPLNENCLAVSLRFLLTSLSLTMMSVLVPLIFGRPFLRTSRALVDVHEKELILRVSDEKLTFKVDSTSKYSHKYEKESINMIDIFDTTCEDHFHEVLKFQKLIHPLSGNPTPSSYLVVASLSPSLTPFGDSAFLLEETDTLLFHFDYSLPDYEAFFFDIDHQEEKSSGNTISHSDPSLLKYESFYFDLSIDPPSIFKRSNSHHKEFADELAHIISPPEYDHFY